MKVLVKMGIQLAGKSTKALCTVTYLGSSTRPARLMHAAQSPSDEPDAMERHINSGPGRMHAYPKMSYSHLLPLVEHCARIFRRDPTICKSRQMI